MEPWLYIKGIVTGSVDYEVYTDPGTESCGKVTKEWSQP